MKQKPLTAFLSKTHRFMFYASLILLPTQLGKHWWPEWSYVLGRQIDYLSPTMFLTDITMLICIISWLLNSVITKNIPVSTHKNTLLFVFVGLLYVSANVVLATRPVLALWGWVKNGELLLFGYYIYKTRPDTKRVFQSLFLAAGYTAYIAITQFFLQHSLNGVLWWLGERYFSSSTIGIAKTTYPLLRHIVPWFGNERIEPYATFPHPNVLAGFISIILTVLIYMIVWNKKLRAHLILLSVPLVLVLYLAQSISAYIALSVGALFLFLIRIKPKKSVALMGLTVGITCLFIVATSIIITLITPVAENSSNTSLTRRTQLNTVATTIIVSRPFFGVGAYNFIPVVPSYVQHYSSMFLQPVHNIYLLLLSEYGLVSICVFFLWIMFTKKRPPLSRVHPIMLLCITELLIIGSLDHYSLTLQQGKMLMTVFFSLFLTDKTRGV